MMEFSGLLNCLCYSLAKIEDSKPAVYNPWPGFKFSGKLRPWPQVIRVKVAVFRCMFR